MELRSSTRKARSPRGVGDNDRLLLLGQMSLLWLPWFCGGSTCRIVVVVGVVFVLVGRKLCTLFARVLLVGLSWSCWLAVAGRAGCLSLLFMKSLSIASHFEIAFR